MLVEIDPVYLPLGLPLKPAHHVCRANTAPPLSLGHHDSSRGVIDAFAGRARGLHAPNTTLLSSYCQAPALLDLIGIHWRVNAVTAVEANHAFGLYVHAARTSLTDGR